MEIIIFSPDGGLTYSFNVQESGGGTSYLSNSGYQNAASAVQTAENVKNDGTQGNNYEKRTRGTAQFSFSLYTSSQHINLLGNSQDFTSIASRDDAIDTMINQISKAPIRQITS